MCKLLVLLTAAGAIQAAIIKGTVVENETGKVLARTLISIQPIPGTQGPSGSVRTNTYGAFEFIDVPAGGYVIRAARRGFMPAAYGQKNWRAAGQPVFVDKDQAVNLMLRLNRFSSISGVVVDENDVGLPEHEVIAMSNTRPPRMLQKAQADDRGVYRIAGLEPGTYLVRTLARQFEDGGYVPTFHRETARVEEAGTVDTVLDSETTNIKVQSAAREALHDFGGGVHLIGRRGHRDSGRRCGTRVPDDFGGVRSSTPRRRGLMNSWWKACRPHAARSWAPTCESRWSTT